MLAKWISILGIINLIRMLSPRDQFQSDTLGEAWHNDNNYVDDLGSDLERTIHYHVGGQVSLLFKPFREYNDSVSITETNSSLDDISFFSVFLFFFFFFIRTCTRNV